MVLYKRGVVQSGVVQKGLVQIGTCVNGVEEGLE